MIKNAPKFIEHAFLFLLLIGALYLMWNVFSPFLSALAFATVVVTICYPLYERILKHTPRQNESVAAFISLGIVLITVFLPVGILGSFILKEALSIYGIFNAANNLSFLESLEKIELAIRTFVPTFSLDAQNVIQQTAQFFVEHLLSFFAGTASTLFMSFITLFACYYFFRDGKYFTSKLVSLSPLKDADDALILKRLAQSIRAVILGTVTVAIVQGTLTTIGLSIVGFDRAVFLGCIAAVGALIPGVGTAIVIIPSIIYLFVMGEHVHAVILIVWGTLAVGLIDNILGPYVMSKGNKAHPFLILLSVLGGISVYGPLGFILGPVIVSLLMVLLELYRLYLKNERT